MRQTLIHPLVTAAAVGLLFALAMTGILLVTMMLPQPVWAQQNIEQLPDNNQAANQAGEQEGIEYLTRGPVHEAFAEQYNTDPTPGVVIDKQPPEPIDEIPPEYMPEGDNVVWIPGYWTVSPETNDFIWVSGLWRNIPHGQRWIPGYWTQVENGYQWISGFWTAADTEQLSYLPYPPDSLEAGPTSAAPGDDYFWVPGCWMYQQNDYQWRPGYWSQAYNNWVWIPARYVWTPRGAIYANGYWDYSLRNRGTLFTPVSFSNNIYAQAGFRYRPSVVVSLGPLLLNLFVGPRYNHYYYGDYYASSYNNAAVYPWYYRSQRGYGYDPLLTYYQYTYARSGINLVSRLTSWNNYLVQNVNARPPHTLSAQQQFLARVNANVAAGQNQRGPLAQPLSQLVRSATGGANNAVGRTFRAVDAAQRDQFSQVANSLRQLEQERLSLDGKAGANVNGQAQSRTTLRLPASSTFRLRENANVDGKASGRLNLPGSPGAVGQDGRNVDVPRPRIPTQDDIDRGNNPRPSLPGNVNPGNVPRPGNVPGNIPRNIPGNVNPGNVNPGNVPKPGNIPGNINPGNVPRPRINPGGGGGNPLPNLPGPLGQTLPNRNPGNNVASDSAVNGSQSSSRLPMRNETSSPRRDFRDSLPSEVRNRFERPAVAPKLQPSQPQRGQAQRPSPGNSGPRISTPGRGNGPAVNANRGPSFTSPRATPNRGGGGPKGPLGNGPGPK